MASRARGCQSAPIAEFRASGQTGTDPAIYCSSKSDTPFNEKLPRSTHGGARLRASRTSNYLSVKQARAIMLAAMEASRIGAPFNRMITVHWERAGLRDDQAAAATGRLTKLASDWARRRGSRLLWAWTRENDAGKGSHLHLLIACPPGLPIGRMWRGWIKSIARTPYRRGVVNTRRIGGALAMSDTNPAEYRQHLFRAAAYTCKGVHPDDAAGLGIRFTEPGGTIIGKRSAVCQALLAVVRQSFSGSVLLSGER